MLGIVGEIVVMENGGGVVVDGTADDVGDMIAHRRVKLVGTGHVEVLVGGSVEVGLVERHACVEDNARDALHRGVELPLTGFLPIQVIDGTVQGGGEHGFDVHLHARLIVFQEGAIAGTALHPDGLGGVDDDA